MQTAHYLILPHSGTLKSSKRILYSRILRRQRNLYRNENRPAVQDQLTVAKQEEIIMTNHPDYTDVNRYKNRRSMDGRPLKENEVLVPF